MNRIAGILMLLLANSLAQAGQDLHIDARLFAQGNADRVLLVTFYDRTLRRPAVGPRINHYVARGYAGSTWSRRTAREIGSDYQLEHLADWPVTELTLHCVAYLVADDRAVAQVVAALAGDPRVADAQAMQQFETHVAAGTDPYLALQANLHELGLAALHDVADGAGVRVAVIDTGVDLTHPDLVGQIEIHENFVTAISPDFSTDRHGTGVAGIIGARAGNGAGIVGIAPRARLFAYKACWPVAEGALDARCNSFTLALAINAALRTGADIINLSLSGPHDPLIEALLGVAARRGVIVVAADHGAEQSGRPSFPASMPGVVAVRADEHRTHSGALGKAVGMPGLEILSTVPGGSYDFLTGCSFSAAQVSGLAALARQLHPATTGAQLIAALRRADTDVAAGILALIPSS